MEHACGHKHRSWNAAAKCRWPKAQLILGEGEWASLAPCGRWFSIFLFETRDEAAAAKAFIDQTGCGGTCRKNHYIARLR